MRHTKWLPRVGLAGCAAAMQVAQAAAQDQLAGDWQGTMTQSGVSIPVSFHFNTGSRPSGRFTSLTQRTIDYPLDTVTEIGEEAHFTLGGETGFDGHRAGDNLFGTFKDEQDVGTFVLHRVSAPTYSYHVTDVTFRNGLVTLSGTLVEPRTPGRHPAVVLLQGSGPEVRWGTNRYIADRLARAGIAVLIYDKRGCGESGGDWKTADFDDLARDALAGVDLLASRPSVDPRRIGLHGHSQGGIVAPDAVRLAPGKIAFVIAEDTVAGPVWQQDIYRVRYSLTADFPADQVSAAMQVYSLFVDVARGVASYDRLEAAETAEKGQSWLDALGLPPKDSWLWSWYRKTGNVDTLSYWRAVHVPTLLASGQHDALVPVDESLFAIGKLLTANEASHTAIIVPGAEHNLTIRPQPGQPFFWWHVAPGYYDLIAAWIRQTAAPNFN